MSKIPMDHLLTNNDKKSKKKKKTLLSKRLLITFLVFSFIVATSIILIINKLVDLPFKAESRNVNLVVQDSVNVKEVKINQVKQAFLLILPNSFWDHSNFTDIDYSNKTINLAINNVLGYDDKKQSWDYFIADDGVSEIVSVVGKLTLDNVKYEANIQFNILDNYTYFYDLYLKEDRRRARYLPATPRQKSLLIQMMYRS
jgi:hypothetical protein